METDLSQYFCVAATGHRPNKLGGYGPSPTQDRVRHWLMAQLCEAMNEYECNLHPNKKILGISGMALGVDQWFAEECLELGVSFIAAVPFPSQASRWPQESQEQYQQLLDKALEVVYVSPDPYSPQKMQIRNIWMVDRCQRLLAVCDGTSGGTRNCLIYANDHEPKVDLRIFNPKEL